MEFAISSRSLSRRSLRLRASAMTTPISNRIGRPARPKSTRLRYVAGPVAFTADCSICAGTGAAGIFPGEPHIAM